MRKKIVREGREETMEWVRLSFGSIKPEEL